MTSLGRCIYFYYIIKMARELTATEHKQVIHQVIFRLSQLGLGQKEIAQAVDYSQSNVSCVLRKIKEAGNLEEYEVGCSSGRPSKLDAGQIKVLKTNLKQGAKACGFPQDGWTRLRVQSYIRARFEVHYSLPHISRLMKRLGYSLQKPAIRDSRRSEDQIEYYEEVVIPELKKNS